MATSTAAKAQSKQKFVMPVHTMVRRIGTTAGVGGVQPPEVVDADIEQWLKQGYTLKSTHLIGLEAGVLDMAYVLAMGFEKQTNVHTMVRRIGATAGVGGVQTTEQVAADMEIWYNDGYRLFGTHLVGLEAGVLDMVYILVK